MTGPDFDFDLSLNFSYFKVIFTIHLDHFIAVQFDFRVWVEVNQFRKFVNFDR